MSFRTTLTLLVALTPGWSMAQEPAEHPLKHDPVPTVTAITATDLMTRLYIFADDSMQGREVGTEGHLRGTTYLASELERLGLQPAGDSGTFYQDFGLEERRVDPKSRMSIGGADLTMRSDFLIFPAIGLPLIGKGFDAVDVPVVYGGRIGEINLIPPEEAVGKLVLFAPADGPQGWQFWSRFGPAQYGGYREAAGLLIAALDVVPSQVAGFLLGGRIDTLTPGVPSPAIAVAFVTQAVGETLMGGSLAGLLPGVEHAHADLVGGPISIPAFAPGRNVVAIVPGTDSLLRHQYVSIGGHSDHDGLVTQTEHDSLRAFNSVVRPGGAEDMQKQPTPAQLDTVRTRLDSLRAVRSARPDSIMNGADDDGSGSMALLELAEYFRENPTRRSLLFVWHAGEEKGLFGSSWYTDHPTVPRDSIVANINLDMIGRGGPADIPDGGPQYAQLIGSRKLSTQLGDLVEEVNSAGNHGFVFDYQFDAEGHPQQYYCRSDHYEYARYGIPIVFLTTGSHPDYHMVTDEPQYINYQKYARVTSFVMDLVRTVADLDERPVVDKEKPDPRAPCRQ